MTSRVTRQDDRRLQGAVSDAAARGDSLAGDGVVGLLTGGFDKPYALGLSMALVSKGLRLDVIGGPGVDCPEMHSNPILKFLNLQNTWSPEDNIARKVLGVLIFYVRLMWYALVTRTKVFHILWNNKVPLFDRTLLMLYYKLCGKKIVFTAHNVNAGERDDSDSFLNRLTLKCQYHLADHVFVHTEKMKEAMVRDFGVPERRLTVIPFGVNNTVPDTELTTQQARERLGIKDGEKTILFFGAIRPYKGLEYMIEAFRKLTATGGDYKLIVAGEPKKESAEYLRKVLGEIDEFPQGQVLKVIEYVPDEDTELYFKAADVLALPYTHVYQSGVLFLAYGFGLPAVATDVGSFRDDIVEGETGFVCSPRDPASLASAMETYFSSPLYQDLENRRADIRSFVRTRNSWDTVGAQTTEIYSRLLEGEGR